MTIRLIVTALSGLTVAEPRPSRKSLTELRGKLLDLEMSYPKYDVLSAPALSLTLVLYLLVDILKDPSER